MIQNMQQTKIYELFYHVIHRRLLIGSPQPNHHMVVCKLFDWLFGSAAISCDAIMTINL